MTTSQMRTKLKTLYPGQKWQDRVDSMKESQVVAIFLKKQETNDLKPVPTRQMKGQMTINDFMQEEN